MEQAQHVSLAGQVALVTGARQGIGYAIAARLAQAGARVAVSDRDGPGAEAAAERLRAAGGEALALELDVSNPAAAAAGVAAIAAAWGRLDILVNNAGIVDVTGFDALTLDHYHAVLKVNLDGALIVTMAAAPLMRAGGPGGRILNVASIMGLRGSVGALSYSTAKGGMVNLTRALACDLAKDGIVVNALAPGFIDTPMSILPDGAYEFDQPWFKDIYLKYGRIPLGRPGLPEDVAGPALFLCSADALYVTGQVLSVDGGLSATF